MESRILKLRILTAAVRLKFKCRARIECADANTQEALSNNGLFAFHEELHLFPKGSTVELALILISEKGSWYNGGSIKTTLDQLRHSGGLPLKLTITKCIDKDAWIEIQAVSVPQVADKSSQRELSFTQHRMEGGGSFIHTPQRRKGNLVIQQNLAETRSEHGINQPFNNHHLTHQRKYHDTSRPIFGEFSNVRMQKVREPRRISPFQTGPNRNSPDEWASQDQVTRAREEADLSTGKLKKIQEKYKQQQENLRSEQEKRKNAEFSEHNYKMEVLKLSIYKEQKEKECSKKDGKIKQLEAECRENSKKLTNLREDVNNKNAQIEALKNEAKTYKADLAKVSNQMQWCRKQFDEKIAKYQKEASAMTEDREDALNDLRRKLKSKQEELISATSKLSKMQQENERQKKSRLNVESKYNDAKSDYERTISNLRKELKTSKDEWAQTASKYQRERNDCNKELSSIRQQCDRLKVSSSKSIIQKRSLQQQVAALEESASQLKKYKEKYTDQCGKGKSLKDQLSKTKRKYENVLENNHKLEDKLKNSSQRLQEYSNNYQLLEHHCAQLEEKMRALQAELDEKTLMAQKLRKSEQELIKECFQFREREKQTKSYLSRKDIQLTKMKLELQNLTEKLNEVREVRVQHHAQRYYPSYNEQLQESKYGILQTQRYMDMEIVTHKHTIAELENQLSRSKEEADKYTRLQYECRDLQRTWQAEKLKITTQNSKLAKEMKELTRKIAEEQTKVATINEKLQKEKKNSKNLQQKCVSSENALRKAQDGREQMLSQLEIKEGRLKMMESEMVLLKGEIQLRQTEGNKLRTANESLQAQNRRLRQQVTELGVRLRQQQILLVNQSKKAREEMARCESRLVNIKRENEKFKQSLRNVLVQSIISQLPKEHQSESLAKKRQNKLGLTLTNQLIIRLQDYLRELSRLKADTDQKLRATEKELIVMREQSILKTNQFQNSEAQLRGKLDELMDNLAKMKDVYEAREEDMRKTLAQTQWQLTIKDKELQRLEQSAASTSKRLQGEVVAASQSFSKTQRALNAELEKLKTKIKQQGEKQTSYCEQISSLEEYINSLEEKTAKYRDREFELQQKIDKFAKQLEQNRSRSESLAQSLQQCNKQKSQLKNLLSQAEADAQECKLLCDRYKGQLDVLEREKSEGSSTVRSIMKEKEALLHQYLASQQKAFQLETQLLAAQQQLAEVSSQLQAVNRLADQMKEQKKKIAGECKTFEANLAKRQNQLKELQQKIKDRQRQASKLTQQNTILQSSLSQIKAKLDASSKNWQLKLSQAEKANELANSEAKTQSARSESYAQKCEYLQQQLKRAKQSLQSQQGSLEQMTQRLAESLQANEKMEVELFSCKSQLTQLRIDVGKAKEEIEDKDLKNYMLSSQLYKIEETSAQQITALQEKITAHEQAMLKYEQICEDFATQVEILKKAKQLAERGKAENETEFNRMVQKWRILSEELDAAKRTISNQETELGRLHEERLQLQSFKNNQDQQNYQAILEMQQKLDKRECELQRSKSQIDLLHQMLKKLEENCRQGETQLQDILRKCSTEAENAKKYEIQLKKMREDLKQLTWTNERELKKLLQTKLRTLTEATEANTLAEQLKSVEEALLQMLGRYDTI